MSLSLAVFVVCLLTAPASATPLIKSIRPLGAQRGTTFTLTLVGQELTPGCELITTLPATISRLAPRRDLKTPESELPFLVELRADAPVAAYPVRLKSEDGISNIQLFSVSDFPELDLEKDERDTDKDKIPTVQKISPPVVVNSFLKVADQDVFRFTAQAGQTLVFEVEARRLGSAIDPVLRVLDSMGREIAFSDDDPGIGVDARVQVKFPHEGEYRVVVHDSRFSDQEQNFYRLKVGNYSYAQGLFPLGWQRGNEIDVTLFGGNLARPVTVRPSLRLPASQKFTMASHRGTKGAAGSLAMPFVVSDLPEILESDSQGPMVLPSDTVVNGRISKPGEKDLYRLPVKPGEKWLFEVQAASLGTTRMGAWLGIHDGTMKLLSSGVDASSLVAQTEFSFTPPEKGVDPKILFKVPEKMEELILSVEDINHGGGPDYGYRLRATRKYEDFSLELATPYVNIPAGGSVAVPVRVIRDTYYGPIQLRVSNVGEDLHVEGGHIPAGVKEGLLVITARPAARLSFVDLEVWGEGISSTKEPIRRRAIGPGLVTPVKGARRQVGGADIATQKPYQAKWMGMELPAGISRPAPIAFELSEREIKLVQGLKQEIRLKLIRNTPISAPIRIEGLRPGGIDVGIRAGTIDPKSDSLPVQVSANFNTRIGRFDMVLVARTDLGGRDVVVTSPCITVDLVRAFALVIPSSVIQIDRDAEFTLEGKVHRQYPFQEAVHLRLEDLPLQVTCASVEVPAIDAAFKLRFQTGAGAQPGDYEVRLIGTAKMEGRKDNKDYTIPDVKLRLKVVGVTDGAATEKAGSLP